MLRSCLVLLFGLIFSFCFVAVNAVSVPYPIDGGQTPPIPMFGMFGDGNEYFIREGMEGGLMTVAWNKSLNIVDIHIVFNGLSQTSDCYPRDPSNTYNKWPRCVVNGKWRFTIVHNLAKLPVEYYYDANGLLLGNEYEYYGTPGLPNLPGVTTINGTGTVMLMSDYAHVVNGRVDQTFRFHYDEFLSFTGTTGVLDGQAYTHYVNNTFSGRFNMYTHPNRMVKPIPTFSFEDILNNINNHGDSLVLLPTLQPFPEPAHLRGRDNLIRGPIAMMNTNVGGGWDRLYDTPTCFAAKFGTPQQKANPHRGNVQLDNYFEPYCLSLN